MKHKLVGYKTKVVYISIIISCIIVLFIVFNIGYYCGSEQSRKMLKTEQAFVLDFSEKVFLENEAPKDMMRLLFQAKANALIANYEFDNKPLYEKLSSQHCFNLFGSKDAMSTFSDSRLLRLCANIEAYNIPAEDKKSLQRILKIVVEPRMKNEISRFTKKNKSRNNR